MEGPSMSINVLSETTSTSTFEETVGATTDDDNEEEEEETTVDVDAPVSRLLCELDVVVRARDRLARSRARCLLRCVRCA